ncbi:hypothetical protein [Blastococcus sp. MG754427]|uniref:hypothetical protein n=1 Tax=Blastococcus sp. MG754427 TaxID=2570318 RepID=UPI001F382C2A|nr:hypothetical protein [Blastococcus sp. MG754427]
MPGSDVTAPSSNAPPRASPMPVRSASESATRVSRTPASTITSPMPIRASTLGTSGHVPVTRAPVPIDPAKAPAHHGPRRPATAPGELLERPR